MTDYNDIICKCGYKVELHSMVIIDDSHIGSYWVECDHCGRMGPTEISARDAVRSYNNTMEDDNVNSK